MIRSDVWLTPDDIYKELCDYWNFDPNIDVAASRTNAKCEYYIDERKNAHTQDWRAYHKAITNCTRYEKTKVWINPPTSQIKEYSTDAARLFTQYKDDIEILMIMPANSFCNPYQRELFLTLLQTGELKIRPIYGKIQFLKGEQDPEQHTLAIFRPHKVGVAAQNWISLMFRKLEY